LGATNSPADSPLWAVLNAKANGASAVTVGSNSWSAMPLFLQAGTPATQAWNDFQANAPAPNLVSAFGNWIAAGKPNDVPVAVIASMPPTPNKARSIRA
jgi:hypothetical protein